jgi:hypothetical protein
VYGQGKREKPEIKIFDGSAEIPADGTVSFGETIILRSTGSAQSTTVPITVKNTGRLPLELTGEPFIKVSGTDAGNFMIATQPTKNISAGGSSSFDLVFTPDHEGEAGAVITIENNDAAFRFFINGTGKLEDSFTNTPISNITYRSVSGGEWTLESDGRYKSPPINDGSVTKMRVSFTSNSANASITIQLDVSSYSSWGGDYAFISQLDTASATYDGDYYSRIYGTNSTTVTIPVPTAGSHFVDIGYRKDSSMSSGSDCAWFTVIQ